MITHSNEKAYTLTMAITVVKQVSISEKKSCPLQDSISKIGHFISELKAYFQSK